MSLDPSNPHQQLDAAIKTRAAVLRVGNCPRQHACDGRGSGAASTRQPRRFHWDLSYVSALAAYPMRANEFLPIWISRYPKRPVHTRFANYAGQKILGSVLMEQPDGHAGEPNATWVVRTKSTASLCTFHPKFMDRPCETLEFDRADAFLREVIAFRPSRAAATEDVVIGEDGKGAPILFNYVGFLSVWVDGRSLQRPISAVEIAPSPAGGGAQDRNRSQLTLALAKLTLQRDEYAARKQAIVAVIARQLVADVNFVDPGCRSVYGEAQTRHSETMIKELLALGVDPGAETRCRRQRR
jgi:hypothetical protein